MIAPLNILVNYIDTGFSTPVEQMLSELKISKMTEFDHLVGQVVAKIELNNREISQRYRARSCCQRFSDYIVGKPVEKETNLTVVRAKFAEIRAVIARTPLSGQTWRTNHSQLPKAAMTLQRAWRFRLREKLLMANQTYESWRIQAIKRHWKDDALVETKRLSTRVGMPSNVRAILAAVSTEVKGGSTILMLDQPRIKVMEKLLCRTKQFKKMYSDSHYVFTHGQSLGMSVVNQCIRELIKTYSPEYHTPLAIRFRIPYSVPYTRNVDDFFEKFAVDTDHYRDNDHNLEVLSADSYLWNIAKAESAIYYASWGFSQNSAIDPTIASKILANVFFYYLQDEQLSKIMGEKASHIAVNKERESVVGALYTICIPKGIVENPKRNFIYRSHAYGKRCPCFPLKHLEVLKKMQADSVVQCIDGAVPQVRILTSRLSEEPGVRTYVVNDLSKVKRREYRKQIERLVREAAFYSSLLALKAAPTEPVQARLKKEAQELIAAKQIDKRAVDYLFKLKEAYLPGDLQALLSEVAA